jgi:prephenate dehydrogenase
MGGSLGLALARRPGKWRVVGVGRRLSRLKKAQRLGCVHETCTDLRAGVKNSSVVVLAAPVKDIVPLAKRVRPLVSASCLVMDVGSVKKSIVDSLEKVFSSPSGPQFVGVHPMAGSEKTGVEHARADLYRGAACVITPGARTSASALRRAEKFWSGVGGRTLRLSPEDHDKWMALISHLPHLLADALVLTAAQKGNPDLIKTLAAGSFRDMTRVAGADPDQWAVIFNGNARHLKQTASVFIKSLRTLVHRRWPLAQLRRAQRAHRLFNGEREKARGEK